ncbi:TadE/TadG family type IV pilus assembly protein [Aliihoeflea sp. 2WW]|uniref:TadE/TadG family type IV pilus assembly protein n=1 Tax=Aliihoeflea sp. 2WW TaxID=1381123 RepID=UPI0004647814|nr:TadE/TadG family type IV pilus assembly protein [Aliihoeflea sp. 2WW]
MTTHASVKTRAGRKGLLRAFARQRDGSTAIEFSILVIPFALLVFAILESCISFAAQQVMTNAADDVARLYRTGQVRPGPGTEPNQLTHEQLRDKICERMAILVSDKCPGLEVDLQTFETFAQAAALRTPYSNNDLDATGFDAVSGGAGSKNVLRVYYRWPIITDLLRLSMSTIKDGKVLHFASVTWQNEPYAE